MKTFLLILIVFSDDPALPDTLERLDTYSTMAQCDAAAVSINAGPGNIVAACIEAATGDN